MKYLYLCASLLLASPVLAQTPVPTPTPLPDVKLVRVGSVYTVKAQAPPDLDMAQICVVRADLDPMTELGCVPAGPDEIVTIDIQVQQTSFDDAEIRAYSVDDDNLVSVLSENAGLIDFTPPGRPKIK